MTNKGEKMEKQEITERVKLYLKAAEEKNRLYPLEEIGLWKIISADTLAEEGREFENIYHGSFLEVVSEAVQHVAFYSISRGPKSSMHSENLGYIQKAEIKELGGNFYPKDLEGKIEV